MVMLSARGISETSTVTKEPAGPFHLDDDSPQPTGLPIDSTPVDLLTVIRRWAEMQRQSYEYLERAFAGVPAGLSVVTSSAKPQQVERQFPVDLLCRSLENILIADERLGLPPGCVATLNRAGIVSLAALAERVQAGAVTRIPRIGKAKTAVISETVNAFLRAAKSHQDEE